MALNSRKQYMQLADGLVQTETIELQTAPELEETVNSALFKASKKNQMPRKYVPYEISRTVVAEEYRIILKRQNAFLAS